MRKHLGIFYLLLHPLIFTLSLSAQTENPPSYINDSTVVRFRYEMQEHRFAQVPDGTKIEDIDLQERDLLKPFFEHKIVTEGLNSKSESYFQTRNIETTSLEEWMTCPALQLMSPSGSFGFDSLGQQTYFFPLNPEERSTYVAQTLFNAQEGYQPIMLFFPSVKDPFVPLAQDQGMFLNLLPDNAFELTGLGEELLIEPETKTISRLYQLNNNLIRETVRYRLFAPYGYVPVLKTEERTRQDLPHPVTFISKTLLWNHVVEDPNDLVLKYTDLSYLEVFPNPITADYEVLMKGVPNALVSQVQVRDHLGNIIHTHLNPPFAEGLISLDSSNYNAGVLILLVHTQFGVYNTIITKS
jgi:hypothetical protein